ncbi:MAG: AmmeMemoRadiSam system protein B, partial [Candidatus Omnitrophica bacterium]|nr:AmmeMemoRadiSam system protein B [Candidatus Omnitrophota bacterium]
GKKLFFLAALLSLASPVFPKDADIQKPAVAGSFYPAESVLLAGQINNYLNDAKPEPVNGNIIALISPHAGYIYSGPVAAYAYKAISGKQYDTIVVIGISHHVLFDGVAYLEKDFYRTPLGDVPIDLEFTRKLARAEKNVLCKNPHAFEEEHSAEVEIPFLQMSVKDFKIVVLLMGRPDYVTCNKLARGIVKTIKESGRRALIVASTDLSHYFKYDDAIAKDRVTLSELLNFDASRFAEAASAGECQLCGSGPVVTAMIVGKDLGADKIQILKYANSGDTAGDKSRVVGYASAVIYKSKEEERMLNSGQKKELLNIARKTVESYVKNGKVPEFKEVDPGLLSQEGAFVTLHKKGELRGCIGNIIGSQPLWMTVRDMAVESSTKDPRFEPVAPDELKDIKIEISVLSQPKLVRDINEIKMGTHGVIVKRGFNSGVFLPQVATETGWSRDEFLSNLCAHKAGLPADAWKDKKTELYTFTAQVFGEEQP